jgi:hypothetical protein
MGNIKISTKLSSADKATFRNLEKKISRGVKSAAGEIEEEGKRAARHRLRSQDAIYTRSVLESFASDSHPIEEGYRVNIWNQSPHAGVVERGARFDAKKPKLAPLIPWVELKLRGWRLVADKDGPLGARLSPYPRGNEGQ